MYQSAVFIAKSVPTAHEIHCLVAHYLDKRDVPVKVVRNGRVISVISSVAITPPRAVGLDTNHFEYKRTETLFPFTAEAGDIATISTHLCYTIKKTVVDGRKNVTLSPLDCYGHIKPGLRHHFLEYLEKQTGLAGLVDGTAEIGITPDAFVTEDDRRRKVWLTGAMHLTLKACVGNPAVFNALAGLAIGNRRSYGFGSISCDMLEKAVVYPFELA